ncbi:MAG: hypothetical protein HOQ05_13140 [Corynebacteriales bacterium]|nr:hypothetical protein [Mycobacteriales bacterium]
MDVVIVAPGAGSRVPVLSCADELRALGAQVEIFDAEEDTDIDVALEAAGIPKAPNADMSGGARLIVAGSDGVRRAVLRRLVKRAAPPPSKRPPWLEENRTIADLPSLGLLPLDPPGEMPDLVQLLELPATPAEVAAATYQGHTRRLDLFRNDGGSLTIHGVLLGAADEAGNTLPWQARIDVDDILLAAGEENIVACSITNAGGYGSIAGVDLVTNPDPADGKVSVGVAIWAGKGIEVRKARGRAVAISPGDTPIPFTDDGVDGTLSRKKTWWAEPQAWSVYR